jgi:photosystem II stability/assembly factor-like uncharacterized protein
MPNVMVYGLLLLYLLVTPACGDGKATKPPAQGTAVANKQTVANLEKEPKIRSAAFHGNERAWIVTLVDKELLRTVDGGVTWSKVPNQWNGNLQGISFIDAQHGWAVDETSQVWRSTDGGGTWTPLTRLKAINDDPGFIEVEELKFVDQSHGWIVETFHTWYTTDGGLTWEKSSFPQESQREGQLTGISLFSKQVGWLSASNEELFYTNDGGQTWHLKKVSPNTALSKNPVPEFGFTDVYFVDENQGWLSSADKIYRTTNAGKNWQAHSIGKHQTFIKSIHFLNKKEGWAVGYVEPAGETSRPTIGAVLYTEDGGLSWTSIQVGENEPLFNFIFFSDGQHGWLFSRNNIYRTSNTGKTWVLVRSIQPATLN